MPGSLPSSQCRTCGYVFDEATGVSGKDLPAAGDISLCLQCATIGIFTEDGRVVAPTAEQLQEIEADPLIQRWRAHIVREGPGIRR